MKLFVQLAAVLPLLLSSAYAQEDPNAAPEATCRTELGTKSSRNVPTYTTTVTARKRPTQTLAKRKTLTFADGRVSTETELVTVTSTTTNMAVTGTFTTTTTVFEVKTVPVTETVTATRTYVVRERSTSTTVVPTTAGFKPIGDTINSDTLGSMGKKARFAAAPHHDVRAISKNGGVMAASYPSQVICTVNVPNTNTKTIYRTLEPASKTIIYFSSTTTKTKTIPTTTTIVPAKVTNTITKSTTSHVTTSTTTITTERLRVTSTSTSIIPGPTLYDACKPGNYFGPNFNAGSSPYYAVNVVNNGPGVASDFTTVADGASTAEDCCYACQQYPACETFLFRQRNRNCFLLFHQGATCPSQANHPNFILSRSGSDSGAGYVVGNGNCGFTYSGNSDGSVFPVDQ